jgi:hypothetical protein
VAAHDLRQSCSVWRATGSRVDHGVEPTYKSLWSFDSGDLFHAD